jgi:tRNA A37 threonylcarbamoyladenosine synthetase subunit TsaC/SUA5/YrdC
VIKEINLTDHNFLESVIGVFSSDNPVIILEFTGTYGLVAPNTNIGTKSLDYAKTRLDNKYYGSILGNCETFRKILPHHLKPNIEEIIEIFKGAFVRFEVENKSSNSKVIKDGKHQVLIENPDFRKQIELVELMLIKQHSESDFFLENYQGLLCTSANISGDANGAITDLEQALEFGKAQGIELFVHSGLLIKNLGSYPSYYIGKEEITIERKGYRDAEIFAEAMKKIYAIT